MFYPTGEEMKNLGVRLKEIFGFPKIDDDFYYDIEDALVESDIGASMSVKIVDLLKKEASGKKVSDKKELLDLLKNIMAEQILDCSFEIDENDLNLFLFLGVNGVGKTTTIAKIANIFKKNYPEAGVVLSAGDTFRAAAIDQLKLHGERLGLRVVHQSHGSDPGAVIFDSIESAKSRGDKIILADTAGRMHNKANLVKELQKIDKIIKGKVKEANYKKILIIDSTTGQNGVSQAEIFNEAVGIDAVIMTKYDSAAKGGIALSISGRLGIPFAFTGTGEKYTDIQKFSKDEYLDSLLNV